MKINLITQAEHIQLHFIFIMYPNLTLQNKGYEYINKDKLLYSELEKFKEVETILSKSIKGFSSFTNFRRNNKTQEIELRFQYNYNYDGGIPFTGVGYILLDELLNGFRPK